ncbi:hypothetical protein GGR50DRAFT_543045 [Xylaria sp. CBS 124048]|nr:hypothetical protein GGR50DRAFT_543045 [Xylaria sp. CBS 124048]
MLAVHMQVSGRNIYVNYRYVRIVYVYLTITLRGYLGTYLGRFRHGLCNRSTLPVRTTSIGQPSSPGTSPTYYLPIMITITITTTGRSLFSHIFRSEMRKSSVSSS